MTTTYAACATLQGQPQPYKLFYTYDAASKTIDGAFTYPNPLGWVAWGVNPSQPGAMLGGSALVVKKNASAPSGASIDDCYLGGYTPSAVQPPSKLTVLKAAAAGTATELTGSFSIKVPAGLDPAQQFPFLYTFGPLSASGELQQHRVQDGMADSVDLQSAEVSGGPAGAPSAVAAAPGPAPEAGGDDGEAAAKPSPPPDDGGDESQAAPAPEGSEDSGDDEGARQPAAEEPGSDDSRTASAAAAPASNSSAGGCSVLLGGVEEAFDACVALSGTPDAYTFMWKLLPGNQLRGAISSPHMGYVGWGQGPGGLKMVPGNAVIVKQDASAAGGASVSDYKLGGYSTSAVTHPSSWTVSDLKAGLSGGRLMAAWTLQLTAAQAADMSAFGIIYTQGPVGSDGSLQPHDPSDGNTATLDLTSASVSGAASASDRRAGKLPKVHGWLAALGLGLLLPLAVAVARELKHRPPWWFYAHVAIAVTGFLLGVAGIGIGLYMRPLVGPLERCHEVMGCLVLGLGAAQLLLGAARPHPENKRFRPAWAFVHKTTGRLLIAVIIANVYIGIHMSDNIASNHRKDWYIVYSVLLGAIFALALAKELVTALTGGGKGPEPGRRSQPRSADRTPRFVHGGAFGKPDDEEAVGPAGNGAAQV